MRKEVREIFEFVYISPAISRKLSQIFASNFRENTKITIGKVRKMIIFVSTLMLSMYGVSHIVLSIPVWVDGWGWEGGGCYDDLDGCWCVRHDEYRWPVPPSSANSIGIQSLVKECTKGVASLAKWPPLKAPQKTIVVSRFFKNLLHICMYIGPVAKNPS